MNFHWIQQFFVVVPNEYSITQKLGLFNFGGRDGDATDIWAELSQWYEKKKYYVSYEKFPIIRLNMQMWYKIAVGLIWLNLNGDETTFHFK